MDLISKILVIAGSSLFLLVPALTVNQGWGLPSEVDPKVIRASGSGACPDFQRDAFGKCRKSHRSYFYGRSNVGGGPGFGK